MLDKLKNDKEFLFRVVSMAVLLAIAMIPLFFDGIISGSDHEYHLSRIKNIADGVSRGDFFVKIHPTSMNGYGYGSGLFYPNFFLYIPALLMVAGVSFELSYKFYLALIFGLVMFTSYHASRRIFKNGISAFITAILYFSSQAFFTNIYDLVALGEAMAMIFVPIVVLGLYNIVYEDFSKPKYIIFAFLGMILAHSINLFLSLVVSVGFIMFNFKRLFLDKEKPKGYGFKVIGKIAKCAILCLLLSIGYWLPMLEQFVSSAFHFSDPWTRVSANVVEIYKIFGTLRPGVGILVLLTAICIFDHPALKKTLSRRFIFAGFFIALMTTWLVPWKIFDYTFINSIQFPRRFMSYSAIFLALGVGGSAPLIFNKEAMKKFLLTITISATLLTFNHAMIATFNRSYLSDDITNYDLSTGCDEWLPRYTPDFTTNWQGVVKTANRDLIVLSEKRGTTIRFTLPEETAGCEFFDVPLLYYKGYAATITTESGETKELEIDYADNNKIRVYGIGESGEITVSYVGTKVQMAAYIINGVAALGTAVGLIYYGRKKKNNSSTPDQPANEPEAEAQTHEASAENA